jgi:hypothetical protein
LETGEEIEKHQKEIKEEKMRKTPTWFTEEEEEAIVNRSTVQREKEILHLIKTD